MNVALTHSRHSHSDAIIQQQPMFAMCTLCSASVTFNIVYMRVSTMTHALCINVYCEQRCISRFRIHRNWGWWKRGRDIWMRMALGSNWSYKLLQTSENEILFNNFRQTNPIHRLDSKKLDWNVTLKFRVWTWTWALSRRGNSRTIMNSSSEYCIHTFRKQNV